MINRVFLIVLDSFGIGALPDAHAYGDTGSNTLAGIARSAAFCTPNLQKWGLGNIEGVTAVPPAASPLAAVARLAEVSKGKDTTTGHWELAGLPSAHPFPTYPNGFPAQVIEAFCRQTGRGVLCNAPYSGTKVIEDYGTEHLQTGKLIVYTSADSVFQIAAHEDIVPVEELYHYCRIARQILTGPHAVGRVIARPFTGAPGEFARTPHRQDFSVSPPSKTLLDVLRNAGLDTLAVGKIYDIFNGQGITRHWHTHSNAEGMEQTLGLAGEDFKGLCFVNLVDFDMLYGHRNDDYGYAAAISAFDDWLPRLQTALRPGDVIFITADHGCDPTTPSTDHSREYVPLLVYGPGIRPINLGTRSSFADVAKTIAHLFGITEQLSGESFAPALLDRID